MCANEDKMASNPATDQAHLTTDEIATIIKEHPGVQQAIVFPSPAPGNEQALMAALSFESGYKFPRKQGRGWDNGNNRPPQDRDEYFIAAEWDKKEDIIILFEDIRDPLPEHALPIFFRIVNRSLTFSLESGRRDVWVDQDKLKKEGWHNDQLRGRTQ